MTFICIENKARHIKYQCGGGPSSGGATYNSTTIGHGNRYAAVIQGIRKDSLGQFVRTNKKLLQVGKRLFERIITERKTEHCRRRTQTFQLQKSLKISYFFSIFDVSNLDDINDFYQNMRYEGHEASPPRSLNNLKTAAQLVKSIFTTKKKTKRRKKRHLFYAQIL